MVCFISHYCRLTCFAASITIQVSGLGVSLYWQLTKTLYNVRISVVKNVRSQVCLKSMTTASLKKRVVSGNEVIVLICNTLQMLC